MSDNEKNSLINGYGPSDLSACAKEQPKTKRKRMTKSEVKQYVDWCFSDSLKAEFPTWNNKKIITEYEKVTGRKLSHQFITAQKKKWVLINGEVIRNSV